VRYAKNLISSVKTVNSDIFSKGSAVLTAFDLENIGWEIERVFFISSEFPEERGNHAHKTCKQLFVCISGKVAIMCKDGETEKEFHLAGLGNNLYVPPGIWVNLRMESNTAIAVITDQVYDELDYMRNWDEYLTFRASK
jgi:dTDP-4-dehydrorhamnose 3,5-epimerase-like enzyme